MTGAAARPRHAGRRRTRRGPRLGLIAYLLVCAVTAGLLLTLALTEAPP